MTLGPDERAKLDALLDHIYEHGTTADGVLRLAVKLCEASRAAERERCLTLIAGPHTYNGDCPDSSDWARRDSECPACAALGAWRA